MKNTTDPKALAIDYLESVGKKDLARVRALLALDVSFKGPSMARTGADDLIAAFERLGAIHVRNEIRRVFADGDEVCLIYDFVTDTPAGALPTIEWLRFGEGRIRSINLYYDRVPWKTVMDEMGARASTHPSA